MLDQNLPFVKAVMKVVADPSAIDAAAETLRQIEHACGIEILRDFCTDSVLPAGAFIPKSEPLSYNGILELFRDSDAFQNHYESTADDDIDSSLYPFLSETQLIIQGMDFTNDHFIRVANGVIHAWTQRAWGQQLADWANTTGWGQHYNKRGDRYSWKYADFYTNMSDGVVKDYELWRDTILKVIEHKCQTQLTG